VFLVVQVVVARLQLPQVLLQRVWVATLAEVFVNLHRCADLLV
jgi:hypothetical protein